MRRKRKANSEKGKAEDSILLLLPSLAAYPFVGVLDMADAHAG
jgi:hypothetical protein